MDIATSKAFNLHGAQFYCLPTQRPVCRNLCLQCGSCLVSDSSQVHGNYLLYANLTDHVSLTGRVVTHAAWHTNTGTTSRCNGRTTVTANTSRAGERVAFTG